MKLKAKMSLVIGGIVAVMLLLIGTFADLIGYNSIIDDACNNMKTATVLGGLQISGSINDYKNMASVTGKDPVLVSAASNDKKAERISELAAQYGFTSGNILDKNGISLKDGTDFSDREYVKKALKGTVNISEITLSKYTGTYGFSVAAPLVTDNGIDGVVYYRMDIDFMEAITGAIDISENSYAYIVDGTGTVIVHPDKDAICNTVITEDEGEFGKIAKKIVDGESGDAQYSKDGIDYLCGYAPIDGTDGWSIIIIAPLKDFQMIITDMVNKIAICVIIFTIVSVIIANLYARTFANKIIKVEENIVKIAEGDFSEKMYTSKGKDEIAILNNAAIVLQENMRSIIGETGRILGAMADRDLSSSKMPEYPGEFNRISQSVNNINEIMRQLIADVRETANHVGVGAKELADAAENLSMGTVAQANSIQTAAEEIDDMAAGIAGISASSAGINAKLKELDSQINNGNEDMVVLYESVKAIEEMSNDIRKIVGAIDSIAFQTNILALNAAVEAASAGQYGKGFAVVADEIGNLAGKCSESSKKTEELIGKCISKIAQAKSCADSTRTSLERVVDNSVIISQAFDEINKDTVEQSKRANIIKNEVNNISDVVQNNTAASEETAAASETLSEHAHNLREMINKFII